MTCGACTWMLYPSAGDLPCSANTGDVIAAMTAKHIEAGNPTRNKVIITPNFHCRSQSVWAWHVDKLHNSRKETCPLSPHLLSTTALKTLNVLKLRHKIALSFPSPVWHLRCTLSSCSIL